MNLALLLLWIVYRLCSANAQSGTAMEVGISHGSVSDSIFQNLRVGLLQDKELFQSDDKQR
jgi:hypothetical protein